jgi:hypothetical protein
MVSIPILVLAYAYLYLPLAILVAFFVCSRAWVTVRRHYIAPQIEKEIERYLSSGAKKE